MSPSPFQAAAPSPRTVAAPDHLPPLVLVVGRTPRLRGLGERLSRQLGAGLAMGAGLEAVQVELDRPADHCLVMDWSLPADGPLAVSRWLAARSYALPHLALVPNGDVAACVQAMQNGACTAHELQGEEDQLLHGLQQAWAGAAEVRRAAWRATEELRQLRARHAALKPIERETMLEMVNGVLNKQAAHKLSIAERTVKKHRASVLKQMGAASIPDLVRLAVRMGLVD